MLALLASTVPIAYAVTGSAGLVVGIALAVGGAGLTYRLRMRREAAGRASGRAPGAAPPPRHFRARGRSAGAAPASASASAERPSVTPSPPGDSELIDLTTEGLPATVARYAGGRPSAAPTSPVASGAPPVPEPANEPEPMRPLPRRARRDGPEPVPSQPDLDLSVVLARALARQARRRQ